MSGHLEKKGKTMLNLQIKKWVLGISGLVLGAASSLAWSQTPTICTNVGGTTPDISIAVASNFYGPAQSIAASFVATGAPGAGKVVRICQNSTGLLVNEINTGTTSYTLFLAANASAPLDISTTYRGTNTPFTYANGIPVLWSSHLTTAQLMSGGVINQTNVTSLAIGNPDLAPYGLAAETILTDLGQWEDQPSDWITEYDNISLTYNAIAAGTQIAGFVSKAQVCQQLGTGYGYHQFASTYDIIQKGILLLPANATTSAFKDYLLSAPVQSSLVSNFCYASPTLAREKRLAARKNKPKKK
jgi:molybdate transport system substrate-binding protein